MWPTRYFCARFFPPRYFPPGSGEVVVTGKGKVAAGWITNVTRALIERERQESTLNERGKMLVEVMKARTNLHLILRRLEYEREVMHQKSIVEQAIYAVVLSEL